MQQGEAIRLVQVLVEAFPNRTVSEGTIRVYANGLADLELEMAKTAVMRLIKTSRWLPTVADVREAYADLSLGPVRPGGEAWGDVVREIHRTGYCGKPQFQDQIVTEIVKQWGWEAICSYGDPVADRARFIQLYDEKAKQSRRNEVSGVPVKQLNTTTNVLIDTRE